jgi:hypothetical protein
MPSVIVRPGEPDEYTIPFTYGWEKREIVGRMRRLKIEVDRTEAEQANLNAKTDAIELSGVDTVRLTDVDTGGSTWTLTGYSREWDANKAGFTSGGNLREGDDNTLINGLIGEVSGWTAGNIASLTGPMSFVFNHAHRHEAIRRIEANVPGEIQFRDFGTVDYVDRLGTDRTGTVTLSSDAGTIEQEIRITERGRELDGTHIRVLGAHEGEAQYFANLVPQSDPATYENEVRYSTPRWSSSEDTDWDRWANKDVADQDTIEEEAASLGEELKESLVEAETVVPTSVGLNVGDTVRVVKDDADLDRDMRVHRLTRRAGSFNETGGDAAVVDKVLLSTRTTLRRDDDAELEEIQRFNSGFQGTSVVIQGGGSRQPVNSSNNAVVPFDYPEIAFENEATLQVRGLPYRAYSSGADVQQGGQFEIVTQGFFDTDQVLDPGDFAQINLPSIPSSYSDYVGYLRGRVITDAPRTSGYELDITINAGVVGSVFSETITLDDFGNWFTVVAEPSLTSDDNASMEIRNPSTQSNTITISGGTDETELRLTDPDHDHSPAPGIIESFPNDPDANASGQLYPTGVDVVINGNTVATDIGTGEFETEVDIAGELTRGAWNDIELTSDTLGHIQATVSIDGYKKIGTQ